MYNKYRLVPYYGVFNNVDKKNNNNNFVLSRTLTINKRYICVLPRALCAYTKKKKKTCLLLTKQPLWGGIGKAFRREEQPESLPKRNSKIVELAVYHPSPLHVPQKSQLLPDRSQGANGNAHHKGRGGSGEPRNTAEHGGAERSRANQSGHVLPWTLHTPILSTPCGLYSSGPDLRGGYIRQLVHFMHRSQLITTADQKHATFLRVEGKRISSARHVAGREAYTQNTQQNRTKKTTVLQ